MRTWFILHGDEPIGPYSLEELKLLADKKDRIRKAGWKDWLNAEEVDELKASFSSGQPALLSPCRGKKKTRRVFVKLLAFLGISDLARVLKSNGNKPLNRFH